MRGMWLEQLFYEEEGNQWADSHKSNNANEKLPKKKEKKKAAGLLLGGLKGREGRVQEEEEREEGAEDRDVRLLSKDTNYYWRLCGFVCVCVYASVFLAWACLLRVDVWETG